jgi:predicted nuclease of predicted toxin-antitoxin system
MTFWLDEQFSPFLAPWIEERFGVSCHSVVNLPVDRGDDEDIFLNARRLNAIIISKDSDFVDLVNRLGHPPQIIWVTCGNRSNALMRELFISTFSQAIELMSKGEPVVELA